MVSINWVVLACHLGVPSSSSSALATWGHAYFVSLAITPVIYGRIRDSREHWYRGALIPQFYEALNSLLSFEATYHPRVALNMRAIYIAFGDTAARLYSRH